MRTTQLNADNRRQPKTDCFCVRCHRDLTDDQPKRWVHVVGGGGQILHHDDEAAFAADADALRGDLGCWPVGMDCARKIGMEFTCA